MEYRSIDGDVVVDMLSAAFLSKTRIPTYEELDGIPRQRDTSFAMSQKRIPCQCL